MKKSKYIVYADCVRYKSNSRNARKHLTETGAKLVIVCINDDKEEEVCRAVRHSSGLILVGAYRRS